MAIEVGQKTFAAGVPGTIVEFRAQEQPFAGLALIQYDNDPVKRWVSAAECRTEAEEKARMQAIMNPGMTPGSAAASAAQSAEIELARLRVQELQLRVRAAELEAAAKASEPAPQ